MKAPDKPIVIELNINIKQEVIYRLAADAAQTIDKNGRFSEMVRTITRTPKFALAALALASVCLSSSAMAQRDPAYAAAREVYSAMRN